MVVCECSDVHKRRRVVLSGGPGAGKTALLELIRQSFCSHVKVLPEAASIVFGGGFPREDDPLCRRAAQRAISMFNGSWRPPGTVTARLLSRVIVERSTGWPTGPGHQRSSGRL
jgi:hypothetical protein